MRQALKELGAPENLVQVIEEPTIELSGMLMQMCDACVSTGGPSMVKAAYSSGKPAFGVGAGNVQSLVDQGIDLKTAAEKIARSRTFDNGVLCTCEQCVHVHRDELTTLASLLQEQGAAYISNPQDVEALREVMFPDGRLNKSTVGASAVDIAKMAGLSVPENTTFL
jgi:succinate-semialdehyde dehydrogenase